MKWEEGEGGIHHGSIAGAIASERDLPAVASDRSVLIQRRTGKSRQCRKCSLLAKQGLCYCRFRTLFYSETPDSSRYTKRGNSYSAVN